MATAFGSLEDAFAILAEPDHPRWAEAFSYLAMEPDAGQLLIEAFRDSLEEMGVEPSAQDPVTGEPAYALADIAAAVGVSAEDLESAMAAAKPETSEDL